MEEFRYMMSLNFIKESNLYKNTFDYWKNLYFQKNSLLLHLQLNILTTEVKKRENTLPSASKK